MEPENFPPCSCNAKSSYYCETDQVFLCSHHCSTMHTSHQVYFHTSFLKPQSREGILQSLYNLKQKAENGLAFLSEKVQNIYAEINNYYDATYQEILSSIEKIEKMMEDLQKNSEFILAYPILHNFETNANRAILQLQHAFDLQVFDGPILKEIPKFLSLHSKIDDFFSGKKKEYNLDLELCESKRRFYNIFKEAMVNYPPGQNTGVLANWISSSDCKRNCEGLKLLHLNGADITETQLQCFSYIPRMYSLRELAIENFISEDFVKILESTLVHCKQIENLEMENCELEEKTCENFGKALKNCPDLKEIIICRCQNGDSIIKIIQTADLSNLTTLVLSYNIIGDDGIASLSRLFPMLHKLKYLHLDNNIFANQGGLELQIYLQYLTSLIEIDLSSNKIGEVAGEIFKVLSDLPLLSSINFSSIELVTDQEQLILQNSSKLKYLDTFVFDMTIPDNFLFELKRTLPDFAHLYRENPEQGIRVEFK